MTNRGFDSKKKIATRFHAQKKGLEEVKLNQAINRMQK
jgi:hypothetical protein